MNTINTLDGFTPYETLNHLENGGTLISEKRGDVIKFVDGKFLVFFFIGNRLSTESATLNLDYLPTFKFVEEPRIEQPIRAKEKNTLPLTLTEVKELATKTLDIYRVGWEADNIIWVMRDGTMFSTNHGSLCEFSKNNLSDYISEINTNLEECLKVAAIIK